MSCEDISTVEVGEIRDMGFCASTQVVTLIQKVIAEVIGTYFVIFVGCGAVAVNKTYGPITFPGVAVTWGLIVTVMIYAVGHISGAHFNPAVTITFTIFRHFPLKQFPLYILAQLFGSVLASVTLVLVLDLKEAAFFGTISVGPPFRSFLLEIIITFLLMFVISGVATDTRAIGDLAGFFVGMTVLLNVLVTGPVSGASMNPARSIGPAIVMRTFDRLWVYIFGPIIGAIFGCFAYNVIRVSDKPLKELKKTRTLIKTLSKIDNCR